MIDIFNHAPVGHPAEAATLIRMGHEIVRLKANLDAALATMTDIQACWNTEIDDYWLWRVRVIAAETQVAKADLDAALATTADSKDDIIAALRVEVETLRRYGNKGCTAMADEELNQIDVPTTKVSPAVTHKS